MPDPPSQPATDVPEWEWEAPPSQPVPLGERVLEDAAPHQIRRDGWCQECGRWPVERGGPCPRAALLIETAATIDSLTAEKERLERALREIKYNGSFQTGAWCRDVAIAALAAREADR